MSTTKKNAPRTRDMERINWIEFREWVPAKIDTVLLPLGTLEPHGVAPNGTDILAPVAMAREIAPRVNAMVAPAVPYGFTGILDAYPGSFTIPEDAFRSYVRAVLAGLAKNKFKNIAEWPWRRTDRDSGRARAGSRTRHGHENSDRKLVVLLQRRDAGGVWRRWRSRSGK